MKLHLVANIKQPSGCGWANLNTLEMIPCAYEGHRDMAYQIVKRDYKDFGDIADTMKAAGWCRLSTDGLGVFEIIGPRLSLNFAAVKHFLKTYCACNTVFLIDTFTGENWRGTDKGFLALNALGEKYRDG